MISIRYQKKGDLLRIIRRKVRLKTDGRKQHDEAMLQSEPIPIGKKKRKTIMPVEQ
jgi:hypothetical protein